MPLSCHVMYSDLLKKTKCCYKSVSSLHVEVSSGKKDAEPWVAPMQVCVCARVHVSERERMIETSAVWIIFVVRSALNVHLKVFFNYQSLYQSNKFIIEHHIMYNLQKPYSSPLVTKVSMHFVLLRFQKKPKTNWNDVANYAARLFTRAFFFL